MSLLPIRRPGLPRGMSVIRTEELNALRVKARERDDYLAAVRRVEPKRYSMMARIRRFSEEFARGWMQYEHDLGEALLDVMRERGDL